MRKILKFIGLGALGLAFFFYIRVLFFDKENNANSEKDQVQVETNFDKNLLINKSWKAVNSELSFYLDNDGFGSMKQNRQSNNRKIIYEFDQIGFVSWYHDTEDEFLYANISKITSDSLIITLVGTNDQLIFEANSRK